MIKFSRPKIWGALFIVAGVLLLIEKVFGITVPFEDIIFPAILITIGISFFLPKD